VVSALARHPGQIWFARSAPWASAGDLPPRDSSAARISTASQTRRQERNGSETAGPLSAAARSWAPSERTGERIDRLVERVPETQPVFPPYQAGRRRRDSKLARIKRSLAAAGNSARPTAQTQSTAPPTARRGIRSATSDARRPYLATRWKATPEHPNVYSQAWKTRICHDSAVTHARDSAIAARPSETASTGPCTSCADQASLLPCRRRLASARARSPSRRGCGQQGDIAGRSVPFAAAGPIGPAPPGAAPIPSSARTSEMEAAAYRARLQTRPELIRKRTLSCHHFCPFVRRAREPVP
jgi:hypothetical protein